MTAARLEHVNITVEDPMDTAERLCRLFGWRIRWKGPSIMGGHSVHVGTDDAYLAVYNPGKLDGTQARRYVELGGMNHVGVVVDDLDAAAERVTAEGFAPRDHADYAPGRRFYFTDEADGVEYEVVSYA